MVLLLHPIPACQQVNNHYSYHTSPIQQHKITQTQAPKQGLAKGYPKVKDPMAFFIDSTQYKMLKAGFKYFTASFGAFCLLITSTISATASTLNYAS